MAADNFKARDIGIRVQKKILGRLSGKNSIKIFIDGRAANLLDNVYRLFKYTVSIISFCIATVLV